MSEADISMPARAAELQGMAASACPATSPVTSAVAPQFVAETSKGVGSLLRRAFSFPAMLATCLVGRVFYEARAFNVDPDLWWHIKIGQDIVSSHHWPTSAPFSYTVAGNPWIAYEWLGDVALGTV